MKAQRLPVYFCLMVAMVAIAACGQPPATPSITPEPSATRQPPALPPTAVPPTLTSTPTATPTAVPSTNGGISFTFINATDMDICAIAASISGTDEWSENILEETIKPGDSYTLSDLEPMTVDLLALDCAGKVINVSFETHLDGGAYTWEITGFEITAYEPPEPPPTSPDQVWLVMLYVDADDEPLEQAIFFDLNEAELVGSSKQVHIVAQVDRFEGGFAGDGDWSTAKRFYVTQDTDLNVVNSEELMDLGEVNMADESTLADFISWAIETYPADKHVLILADHGTGWPGGWTDHSASGDILSLLEIEGALAQVQTETSLEQLELIGFDACLMSSLEVYTAVAPYARYGVASEELEPWLGWAYADFLADLVSDPGMSGADLAQSIVRHYVEGDAAVVGAPKEVIQNLKDSITLAAVDLATIPDLLAALDELVIAASEIDQGNVALSRFYSQSYFSIFGKDVPPSFLDLGHLAMMLAEENRNSKIYRASRQMLAILDQVVIAEKHGSGRPGSTGITLYFPNSTLYGSSDLPGSKAYSTITGRFANMSLWDDFLLSHYTGAPMPARGAGSIAYAADNTAIIGPGVGNIVVAPISASSDVFSMDEPVSLSTEITGGHVAQIFLFQALYVEESNSLLVLSNEFVQADRSKEVNGVIYPDWASQTIDGVLPVGGDLWPLQKVINDGTATAIAMFWPIRYGAGNDTYVIYGTHISAATGDQRYAMMRFDLETPTMINLVVFTEEGGIIAPRELAPQPGDQFIVELTWIDQATGKWYFSNGDALTFGDEPFRWGSVPSHPGKYFLGGIIVDLDGNTYQQSIWMTVEAE